MRSGKPLPEELTQKIISPIWMNTQLTLDKLESKLASIQKWKTLYDSLKDIFSITSLKQAKDEYFQSLLLAKSIAINMQPLPNDFEIKFQILTEINKDWDSFVNKFNSLLEKIPNRIPVEEFPSWQSVKDFDQTELIDWSNKTSKLLSDIADNILACEKAMEPVKDQLHAFTNKAKTFVETQTYLQTTIASNVKELTLVTKTQLNQMQKHSPVTLGNNHFGHFASTHPAEETETLSSQPNNSVLKPH